MRYVIQYTQHQPHHGTPNDYLSDDPIEIGSILNVGSDYYRAVVDIYIEKNKVHLVLSDESAQSEEDARKFVYRDENGLPERLATKPERHGKSISN